LTSSSICGHGEQEILDTGQVLDYGTIGVAHVNSVSEMRACGHALPQPSADVPSENKPILVTI
jgi:hypothetical protein